MRLFGPSTPPLLGSETAPLVRRAMERARLVGHFALVQSLVQLCAFASGILLVRYLDQRDYAWFTIANTVQGAINVLADIGISIGLVSIGGRVWHERERFSQLIATGQKLRWRLGAVAVLGGTPVLYFLLARNGAPPAYSFTLIAVLLAGLAAQLSFSVLNVVPRLVSDLGRLQTIDFAGALFRLVALVACAFVFLNALVAVLVGSLAALLQYLMIRRAAGRVVDLHASENPEDRRAMLGFIKSQAPNAIFFCIQGQITIFLISFFGERAGAVAELGALGRLAMIFAVMAQLLANIFIPAFARAQTSRRIAWQYAAIVSSVSAFGGFVLVSAAFFPNEFLFVLGNKYAHLERELFLMVAGTVANALISTLWLLNASKAWVRGSWLYIPATLATQVALIPWLDFSSVYDVLVFNLISTLPNFLVNLILAVRGFAQLRQGRPAA